MNASLSGTITVNNDATIALSSAPATTSQTVCISTAITNITYAIGGGGTGATVTGLPTGLTTGFSGGTFTISGSPTQSGTFNYTMTASGPCVKPAKRNNHCTGKFNHYPYIRSRNYHPD